MEFHQEVEEEVVFNPPPPYDHVEEIEDDEIDEEDDEDDDYDDYDEDDYDDDEDDDYGDEDREEEVDDEDSEEEEEQEDEEDEEEEEEEEEEGVSSPVIPSTALAPPYAVIHHGRKNCKQTMYSISEGIYSVRSVPEEMHGMSCCCASSHGWLLMLDNTTKRRSNCFLLNPTSMEKIELPPKKTSYTYTNCILTSSPPDCLVMFVSIEDNSCLFCRPNKDHKWTLKVFGPKGNNNGNGFKYLNASVSCKGKIYISFGGGSGIKILDYKEEENDERKIGNRFMVQKIKFETDLSDQFETFHNSKISTDLVESCGDVFMVVRILLGGNDDLSSLDVYTFNVFKLDSSSSSSSSNNGGKISWKKVESLGDDRVFFVDTKCSLSASASKTGLMANHIYFFQSYDLRYMYKFKMGSGLITNTLCWPHLVPPVDEPYWML